MGTIDAIQGLVAILLEGGTAKSHVVGVEVTRGAVAQGAGEIHEVDGGQRTAGDARRVAGAPGHRHGRLGLHKGQQQFFQPMGIGQAVGIGEYHVLAAHLVDAIETDILGIVVTGAGIDLNELQRTARPGCTAPGAPQGRGRHG